MLRRHRELTSAGPASSAVFFSYSRLINQTGVGQRNDVFDRTVGSHTGQLGCLRVINWAGREALQPIDHYITLQMYFVHRMPVLYGRVSGFVHHRSRSQDSARANGARPF